MNFSLLLNAPVVVQLHAYCAIAALIIGGIQLARTKGGIAHRTMGYIWVTLMVIIALSSFWIHEINQWNGFNLIHLLSVLTLVSVPLGIHAIRRGNVDRHRKAMTSLFWSALVVGGLFTLMPGRIVHRMLFG